MFELGSLYWLNIFVYDMWDGHGLSTFSTSFCCSGVGVEVALGEGEFLVCYV